MFECGAPARNYIDLLKSAIDFSLFGGDYYQIKEAKTKVADARLIRPYGSEPREKYMMQGRWPCFSLTLLPRERLDNIETCLLRVLQDKVPGDLIETGVWRGGATILMKGILQAMDCHDRRVVVADSFEGLPRADLDNFPLDADTDFFSEIPELAVSLEEVKSNFARFGVLDDNVEFIKGWFKDTLPDLKARKWALIRLDGDMYESIYVSLNNLYDGLSPGGFVIVDDYYFIQACSTAVDDFRRERNITESIHSVGGNTIYWRKSI